MGVKSVCRIDVVRFLRRTLMAVALLWCKYRVGLTLGPSFYLFAFVSSTVPS